MTVLVLGDELDLTADRVVAILIDRGVPVFRADTAWFPRQLTLDARLDGERWAGRLRTAYRELCLDQVRSVWYRMPTSFRFSDLLSGPERRHAEWEAKFGVGGVLVSLAASWVNHPQRESDACYKPAQLAIARRCGLRTPETIITNHPEAVRDFADRSPDGIVVKTLSTPAVLESSGITVAYTRRLTGADLVDLSGVEITAHLFQTWIDKSFDVRVVVVGARMFAIRIDAATLASRVDWRNDLDALDYHLIDTPTFVRDAITRFMTAFGLSYSAMDFVVDRDGHWWFLEANPGGQYGWLEAATGAPISSAIADLLEEGHQ